MANISETYRITVDYSKSVEEMLSEAHFDYINSGITGAQFPIEGNGKQEHDVVLVSFNENRTTEQVTKGLEDEKLTAATIAILLRLATEWPSLQQSGDPIVGLGSQWERSENEHVVPVLRGNDENGDRNMHLLRTENKWNTSERFAAVKK